MTRTILLLLFFLILVFTRPSIAQTNFWQQCNGSFGGIVSSIVGGSAGLVFAGTSISGGVFRSTNSGATWNYAGLLEEILSMATTSQSAVLLGTANAGVFLSIDSGVTWVQIGMTNYWINAITVSSKQHIFVGTEWGIFRSTNTGGTWIYCDSGATNLYVRALVCNSTAIFAGSDGGGVFRSTDDGDSWMAVNTGLGNHFVNDLAANPDGVLYAATGDIFFGQSGTVYRSTDNGNLWTPVNSGLPNTPYSAITCNKQGDVFASPKHLGVFRTRNTGNSWTEVNSGLSDTSVWSLAVDSSGYLYCGTNGGHVFRSMQSTTAVEDLRERQPANFVLSQNYPNPFNSTTLIRFSLLSSGFVTLKIFNIDGKEISTVLSSSLPKGDHVVEWDAANFASGVYYYRLEAAGLSTSKKMILLR